MIVKRTNYLLFLIFLCSCGLQRANKIEVLGVLYDSETDSPIKEAKVKINLTDPWELEEIETGEKGEFSFVSSGELGFFDDSEDPEKIIRKLKVSFAHPEFVEDYYEEELEIDPIKFRKLDVGAFYLSPKEKQ